MALEQIAENACFGGRQLRFTHESDSCNCTMTFAVFLPPQAEDGPVPALYWLSGLTCTDENFTQKAGAQRYAAEHGIAIIAPDTSPRGDDVPDDPDGAYDFGLAAGFYINATQSPWATHYNMYDYITKELPKVVETNLPIDPERKSISGHSMGGHGALTIALKNPRVYRSVSAFAPIVAPSQVPWGEKAFKGYLGDNRDDWMLHDTCALVANASEKLPLLVDQGGADDFLENQLKPQLLKEACDAAGHSLELRIQPNYDHSYFFIATFISDHFTHHAAALIE